MLGRSTATIKCRQGITNVDAQHNILNAESYDPYEAYPSVSDKNILKNYEADRTSKRNFFLIANNIPDQQLGAVGSRRATGNTDDSSTLSDKAESNIKLDTIRSGESLIKHFNFDTSKYNSVTNKCIAFWRTLMQTDLKPVKCTLLKGSRSSIISELEEEDTSCMWYKALVELQKRKMDEAAFAAIAQQCKLCGEEDPYSEFKKKQAGKYSKDELQDHEDLVCLNYFNPPVLQMFGKRLPKTPEPDKSKKNEQLESTDDVDNAVIDVEDTMQENTISDSQEFLEEKPCGIGPHLGPHHLMKISHSDPCECGRARCECPHDYDSIKRTHSEPCECGRARCACNPYVACPQSPTSLISMETVIEEDNEQEQVKEGAGTYFAKIRERDHKSDTNNGILPTCEICKSDCKCWEHKIEMSKTFIDDSRFELKCQERYQDKSCETETEEEIKMEETKQFCIICGHYGCKCDGPSHKETRKYIEHFEFDDNIITTLRLKKDISLKSITSLTSAEKISRSAFQKQISEHSKEHICCIERNDKRLRSKECIEENKSKCHGIQTMNKVICPKIVKQKKICITPEQRAKDIASRNKVTLELDKYGIPQLVRYADGRLAPKPTTSEDILSNSNHADG